MSPPRSDASPPRGGGGDAAGMPPMPPLGARPYPPPSPAAVSTARLHFYRQLGYQSSAWSGDFASSRPQTARPPRVPVPPAPVELGIGTQGIRKTCDGLDPNAVSLLYSQRVTKSWIDERWMQHNRARAAREAAREQDKDRSARDVYLEKKQRREQKKEHVEEQEDKRNEKLRKEKVEARGVVKAVKVQTVDEIVRRVADEKQRREHQLSAAWQWLGADPGSPDAAAAAAAALWHDFSPHDGEQIERAYLSGAQTCEVMDARFLASHDGGRRLVVRLRPDEQRRRWAEHPDSGGRWAVRRVHKVLTPQHGGISPARERAIDEGRRVAAAVMGQVLQEAELDQQRRAEMMRQERGRRQADQRKLKALKVECAESHRSDAAKARQRRQRAGDRLRREAKRVHEDRRDEIKREIQERKARREAQNEASERAAEKRKKEKDAETTRNKEWREDLDEKARDAARATVRRVREEKERQDAWLRDEAGPAPIIKGEEVSLTRGQWWVRQERLEASVALRNAQEERERRLLRDLRQDMGDRANLRAHVQAADDRRRRAGIKAGGAGFGGRSGGLIKVTVPARRSPRSDDD